MTNLIKIILNFSLKKKLFAYFKNLSLPKNIIVISMLNFVQNISEKNLNKMITKYYEIFGEYFLLIDNIFIRDKQYKYNHHELLYNHDGLVKYIHKTDKIRSLYFLKIEKK